MLLRLRLIQYHLLKPIFLRGQILTKLKTNQASNNVIYIIMTNRQC